ncbi:DUF948 domain-containing protein [Paenibacillus paeoniae]|uniref:DUF948 domain-containing protein n=2 Tax=Paenibacillus paeoniae TaxID=2292705 RepID=A0A371P5Y9_9BACL|nr:DUF948 domain-containing protein [Paenibacillus paeoniae]
MLIWRGVSMTASFLCILLSICPLEVECCLSPSITCGARTEKFARLENSSFQCMDSGVIRDKGRFGRGHNCMNLVVEISIVVVAIATVVMLLAAFRTLKLAGAAIEDVQKTLGDLRVEMLQISHDAREVVRNTNAVTMDAQKKMKELDSLFSSVKEIGQATRAVTQSVKEAATGAVSKVQQSGKNREKSEGGKIAAIADGIASTIRIWNRLKQN